MDGVQSVILNKFQYIGNLTRDTEVKLVLSIGAHGMLPKESRNRFITSLKFCWLSGVFGN